MPRPRVLPSQRRRAAEACNFCRDVKKKCSGSVPCVHCVRRGIGAQCRITLRPRSASASEAAASRHAAAPDADAGPDADPGPSPPGPDPCPPSPSESRPSGDGSSSRRRARSQRLSDASSSVSATLHSRMLLNKRGERVYIGGAASLSFLQVVRRLVADQIGPSPFSHNAQSDTMLEKDLPVPNGDARLDAVDKVGLSRCFRAVTGGFIDVFTAADLEAAVDESLAGADCSLQRRAALNLVLAIGAQVQSPEAARDVGQPLFRRARSLAFEGMLEDPDLDIVRCFLLMAFYLLGECRRNAAFMYLGIATRAAVALGLHSRESYADTAGRGGHAIRSRVWVSLRIVDMLANSILGRPAATAGLNSEMEAITRDVSAVSASDDTKRLVASHQIVTIINGIVDTLYERKESTVPRIQALLGEIQAWERELPQCVRSASVADADGAPRSAAIANIHVSCLYYYAVMLATRPLLISSLTAQPVDGGAAPSPMASACLDAAVFMIQTCVEAQEARLLYRNMCLMKALVFAAGLVLGFDLFAKTSADHAIEAAFGGARDILGFLAASSPQAAHYHEILTLLAKAISKQRETLGSKCRSQYVSKILTLHGSDAPDQDAEGEDVGPLAPADAAPGAMEQWESWLCGNRALPEEGEEAFMGWDTLEIAHWDSFPYVS